MSLPRITNVIRMAPRLAGECDQLSIYYLDDRCTRNSTHLTLVQLSGAKSKSVAPTTVIAVFLKLALFYHW